MVSTFRPPPSLALPSLEPMTDHYAETCAPTLSATGTGQDGMLTPSQWAGVAEFRNGTGVDTPGC